MSLLLVLIFNQSDTINCDTVFSDSYLETTAFGESVEIVHMHKKLSEVVFSDIL